MRTYYHDMIYPIWTNSDLLSHLNNSIKHIITSIFQMAYISFSEKSSTQNHVTIKWMETPCYPEGSSPLDYRSHYARLSESKAWTFHWGLFLVLLVAFVFSGGIILNSSMVILIIFSRHCITSQRKFRLKDNYRSYCLARNMTKLHIS